MSKKSYTLLEYLVALENKVNELASNGDGSGGSTGSGNVDLSGVTNQINNLKNQVELLDSEIGSISIEVNDLDTQVNNLDSVVNNLNTLQNSLDTQVNSLKSKHNNFETTITGRVQQVENRVTTLENNSSTGGSVDLTEVNNRITNNENNISTLQTDVSSLKSRVTTLETNVGSGGNSGSTGSSSDGYGEKLMAHYIHNGNQEIQFSSFNFTTCEGTTTVAHGLTSAKEIMIVPNNWSLENRNNNVMSIPIEWIQADNLLKVVPVDDITLRVTKNDGNTIIPVNLEDTVNAYVDINKIHFEIPVAWSISDFPISSKYCRIITKGYVKSKTNRYLTWKTKNESGTEVTQQMLNLSNLPSIVSPNPVNGVFLMQNYILDFRDGFITLNYDNWVEGRKGGNNTLAWVWMSTREQGIKTYNNAQSGAIKLSYLGSQSSGVAFNSNGSHIYVYSLGGN